jgi:aryl-alcohol dehydrogenase-like predicted oxidoreductase
VATFERTVELGCNFFDCANVYGLGESEELVGRVVRRLGVRERLVLTSKVGQSMGEGANRGGLSRRYIMAEIDHTLRRLQTDYLDVYFMHQPDPATPLEESLRALHDVVTAGKARYIGVSNHHPTELVELLWIADALGLHRPAVLQYPYSLVQRWLIEREIAPLCRRFGLGLITYSPLAVGLLTGEVRDGKRLPDDNHWAASPHAAKMLRVTAPLRATLGAVAQEEERTRAQVAVAWLLANPTLSAPILGAELPAHVDELFAAADWELPAMAKERLDATAVESDPRAELPALFGSQPRQRVPPRR